MKKSKQDKQLEQILFEVYDKGVKQQDCNLTECIENVKQALRIHDVSGSLPSVNEAGVMAVKISETVEPPLTAQEQSFFIAGFCECVKWLSSNDH